VSALDADRDLSSRASEFTDRRVPSTISSAAGATPRHRALAVAVGGPMSQRDVAWAAPPSDRVDGLRTTNRMHLLSVALCRDCVDDKRWSCRPGVASVYLCMRSCSSHRPT